MFTYHTSNHYLFLITCFRLKVLFFIRFGFLCYIVMEVRQFKRRNSLTGIESIVSVSNRNNFSVEDHISILNLNDPDFEYLELVESER